MQLECMIGTSFVQQPSSVFDPEKKVIYPRKVSGITIVALSQYRSILI